MTRPMILFLLPKDAGSTITDVTYWGTGDAERFKSATLNDDGVWSTMQHNGPRELNCNYITKFTVQRGGEVTTWAEGKHPGLWTRTVYRKAAVA